MRFNKTSQIPSFTHTNLRGQIVPRRRCFIFRLALLGSVVLFAMPAHSQSSYIKFAAEVVANAVGPPFNCCSENINTQLGPPNIHYVQPPVSITDTSAWGTAEVRIEGEVAYRKIRVLASGSATQTADGSPQSFYSVAGASFNGGPPEFSDELTISSAGTMKFKAELHSRVDGSPISSGSGTSEPGADCGQTRASLFFFFNNNSNNTITLTDELCDGNTGQQTFTGSIDIVFQGGEIVPIKGRLVVSLYGDASVGTSPSSVVDAYHTAIFTIDPVTPGMTYTTASGISYLTSADNDGDGVPDDEDVFPYDPSEWEDTDSDGIGNNTDTDDDDDTMPDEYELANELNPLDPTDAGIDADGDGYTNLQEFKAGTDPQNANDAPLSKRLPAGIIMLLNEE